MIYKKQNGVVTYIPSFVMVFTSDINWSYETHPTNPSGNLDPVKENGVFVLYVDEDIEIEVSFVNRRLAMLWEATIIEHCDDGDCGSPYRGEIKIVDDLNANV